MYFYFIVLSYTVIVKFIQQTTLQLNYGFKYSYAHCTSHVNMKESHKTICFINTSNTQRLLKCRLPNPLFYGFHFLSNCFRLQNNDLFLHMKMKSVSEFNEFKPSLKSPENRFQLSASLDL